MYAFVFFKKQKAFSKKKKKIVLWVISTISLRTANPELKLKNSFSIGSFSQVNGQRKQALEWERPSEGSFQGHAGQDPPPGGWLMGVRTWSSVGESLPVWLFRPQGSHLRARESSLGEAQCVAGKGENRPHSSAQNRWCKPAFGKFIFPLGLGRGGTLFKALDVSGSEHLSGFDPIVTSKAH